jgi:SAM-dependent methyltransferase
MTIDSLHEAAFERLYCVNALHHFDDKPGFINEARRVLAAGGRVVTIGLDPHVGMDRWYIYEYFAPVLEIDRRRYPSTERVREWMRDAGFVDVHTREVRAALRYEIALARGECART